MNVWGDDAALHAEASAAGSPEAMPSVRGGWRQLCQPGRRNQHAFARARLPTVQDDELLGHRIPKGSWIIVHVQVGGGCPAGCSAAEAILFVAGLPRAAGAGLQGVRRRSWPPPCWSSPCAARHPRWTTQPTAGHPPPVQGAAGLPPRALHARRRVRAVPRGHPPLLRECAGRWPVWQ